MLFAYKAKKGPRDIVEGTIEAASQDAAVSKISQMGLVPVLVKKHTANQSGEKAAARRSVIKKAVSRGKVKKTDVYLFTKKLRVLLKSQEPILNSLYFVEDQVVNLEFKKIVRTIADGVRGGLSFSDSLAKYPQHFSPLFVSIIKAGEASGKLDHSLDQIARYMDEERKLAQKVLSSLAYPVVMVTVGFATIIFIITFVIPKLKSLFEDFADNLPLVTKMLLELSDFLSRYWVFLLMFTVLGGVFVAYSRSAPWQKKAIAALKKNIPVIKGIIYNQSLCRFAGGMSILLSAGIPLLDSIRISIPLVDDEGAKKELNKACKEIVAGSGLGESLKKNCTFLPDMFIKMAAIGETSGKLDEMLKDLAENYADEVETATKIVTSLIEPMAILIVGGILGVIVIAVLLPIFEMSLFMG